MKLKDKKIIVTGGSKGIGFAISKKIAKEGGTVIMCARNEKELELAKQELDLISNNEHYYFVCDVSDNININMFKNWMKYKFNYIDGLVNCAGIYGPIGKSIDVKRSEFISAININLMGTINMCSIFSNMFNENNIKKIINFSGGGAASPFPNYSAYAISKIGIVRLTENMAIELKDDNFEINCIAPGFVATTLHEQTLKAGPENAGEEFYENTIEKMKKGAVSPEKAAELTVFLLSEESNGITGKFISAPWDPWQEKDFQELLKTDKDFAVLRRIDNKQFFKK